MRRGAWSGGGLNEIGPLEDHEIDAAVALWTEAELTRPWNNPHADARLAMAGSNSTVLAARDAKRVVATAMVGFDGHRAWVYYLAVALSHRGRGLGAALMRASEDWSRARGAPKLQLMVRSTNIAASGFYEALGYAREPVSVFSTRFEGTEA